MEPFEKLLLMPSVSDDSQYADILNKCYSQRQLPLIRSEQDWIMRLEECFEMREITDCMTDLDWDRSFPSWLFLHKNGFSPEEGKAFLSTPRFRKWTLPNCSKNKILYDGLAVFGLARNELTFVYDKYERSFFDSWDRFISFLDYYKGMDPKADQAAKLLYMESIHSINVYKAELSYCKMMNTIRKMNQMEVIKKGLTRIKMTRESVQGIQSLLEYQPPDFMDLGDQKTAAYILRVYDDTEQVLFYGNQKYLFYHDFARIPLDEANPMYSQLNQCFFRFS